MSRVLVALTPLPEVFEEAEEKGADFLLFHHPLIFDPLKSRRHRLLSGGPPCQGHPRRPRSLRGAHELRRRPRGRVGRPGRALGLARPAAGAFAERSFESWWSSSPRKT